MKNEILEAIGKVCLNCVEDTFEDYSVCDACAVRKLADYVNTVKVTPEEDVLEFGPINILVNGKWLHEFCRKLAREDLEFRICGKASDDEVEAYGDTIYENMSEETKADAAQEAFLKSSESGFRIEKA